MFNCLTGSLWNSDIFHQILHILWGRGRDRTNHKGDNKINKHPKESDALWRNTKPVVLTVGEELEVDNISQSKSNSADHTCYGSLLIYFFGKDSHDQSGKEGGGCQSECKGHGLGDKTGWWVNSKIGSYGKGTKRGDPGIPDFLSVRNVGLKDFLHQVMRYGGR